jgi:predicted metal-dependent hydrolase
VHVVVAGYQAGRGRPLACARQIEKAIRRLQAYAPEHRGVDVASVLEQLRTAAALVERGSLELPPVQL